MESAPCYPECRHPPSAKEVMKITQPYCSAGGVSLGNVRRYSAGCGRILPRHAVTQQGLPFGGPPSRWSGILLVPVLSKHIWYRRHPFVAMPRCSVYVPDRDSSYSGRPHGTSPGGRV